MNSSILQQLPKIIQVIGPNTIMPIANPTGNPYQNSQIRRLPEINQLKGLQVKAELSKLGEPPRAYSEYLVSDQQDPEDTTMIDTTTKNNSKRIRITERFQRIENAKPALPPIAVNLTRRLQNLLPNSAKLQDPKQRLEKRALQTGRNPRKF